MLAHTPTQQQQLHSPGILLSILFQLLFQLSGVLLLSAGPGPHGPSSRQRDRVGSLWPPQTAINWLSTDPQGPAGVALWDLGARDAQGPIRGKDR